MGGCPYRNEERIVLVNINIATLITLGNIIAIPFNFNNKPVQDMNTTATAKPPAGKIIGAG